MPKDKDKEKKKQKAAGTAPAPWCQDFSAAPGDLCDFTGVPANATITQSGGYWPFCGPNGTSLPSPIQFNQNKPVYIKSDAPVGKSVPFTPGPPCLPETTKNVTIT